MSGATMTTDNKQQTARPDRSVQEIIQTARSAQKGRQRYKMGSIGPWCVSFASASLLWMSFTPVNASPMAWIALVPLLLMVRMTERTRWMYTAIYGTSLIGQLATLQWMRLGDPTMYIAWAALSVYLALYAVAFVAVSRIAVHRWSVPLVVAAPIVWTGLEYARAHLLTGFSWYYLGHSQYRWLEFIQISDLVGAYGVSFVIAAGSAALALMVPHSWMIRLRLVHPSTGPVTAAGMTLGQLIQVSSVAVLFAATLGYGYVRRAQADFQPGPRVALIQGNFLASLRVQPPPVQEVYLTHLRLTAASVLEHPDIIFWPEAMFPWPLLSAAEGMTDEQLLNVAPFAKPEVWHNDYFHQSLVSESQRAGAALVMGTNAAYADATRVHQYNSATFVRPDVGIAGRYDKIHRVPFGEYIPLRDSLPWLDKFTPYRGDWGLDEGQGPAVFDYGKWRMTPIICFEDTVPHLVRDAVAAGSENESGKPVDLLVNLSNDGWFHGSSELDQHLITASFRAVECRTPMVRAVNTGISAIIDGDGAILDPEVFIDGDAAKNGKARKAARDPETGTWYKQLNAALVHTVPLDPRRSLYVRFGDWFAMLCVTSVVVCGLSYFVPQRTKPAVTAT
ncbi:MAG: apolipoprotein N-acyltransferase [Planctomycetes bacterium]|nr:apolipoprotein N-acyltransferase [Planctomycetota bacterium]